MEPKNDRSAALDCAARSDKGLVAEINEDHHILNPDDALFVVVDGMGGHAAGEIASQIAGDSINEFAHLAVNEREISWPFGFDLSSTFEQNLLKTAIDLANTRVLESARAQESYLGMGATVVATLLHDDRALIASVGDSRLYLLRDGLLQQLTVDHTWVREQVKLGLLAQSAVQTHPLRNVVTRALGSKSAIEIDFREEPLVPGDLLLLCSDGLTGMVSDADLTEILGRNSSDLERCCELLIQAANDRGGEDNCTVVLVRYKAPVILKP